MKIALKLNVLLAKNHWRLTFCLPLYIYISNLGIIVHHNAKGGGGNEMHPIHTLITKIK